jgi:glyoxalase family protein
MITGLHHVTAMAGDAQANLDFYAGVLGMRLVKKSVNQDDPGTYHLFYADGEGAPGSDLTFFPWGKEAARGRTGAGMASEVALAVPNGSLGFWHKRLEHYGIRGEYETRFGEYALAFQDHDGLKVALVEAEHAGATWVESSVPGEHQIRGLHGARMLERMLEPTAQFLTSIMGFRLLAEENGWQRYGLLKGKSGQHVDVGRAPASSNGGFGAGTIHHLAWRVPDDASELEVQAALALAGVQPTPVIDRFWFKSVYFREPGGTVFEIATDGPGFAVDEDQDHLGETLVLPPWLEKQRAKIEAKLPVLTTPGPDA